MRLNLAYYSTVFDLENIRNLGIIEYVNISTH